MFLFENKNDLWGINEVDEYEYLYNEGNKKNNSVKQKTKYSKELFENLIKNLPSKNNEKVKIIQSNNTKQKAKYSKELFENLIKNLPSKNNEKVKEEIEIIDQLKKINNKKNKTINENKQFSNINYFFKLLDIQENTIKNNIMKDFDYIE